MILKKWQLKPALTTRLSRCCTKYRINHERSLLYFVLKVAVLIKPTEIPGENNFSVAFECVLKNCHYEERSDDLSAVASAKAAAIALTMG